MKLTIRMNAATDEVELNGHTFDRTGLSRSERNTMAGMVRDALVADGSIKNRTPKSRRERRPRRRSPRR